MECEKEETTSPKRETEKEDGDVIYIKDPKVIKSIIWMIKGSKKNYFYGLQQTQSIYMKRPISGEWQIMMTNLPEYLVIKK